MMNEFIGVVMVIISFAIVGSNIDNIFRGDLSPMDTATLLVWTNLLTFVGCMVYFAGR